MDRRSFIQKAAALAAGSVFGSTIFGCESGSPVNIPCLGPAEPPTPVPGMTYIRASEIGCALDCDLASGMNKHTWNNDATDDGPRINAAMAGASADNPITLIIDGSALISGLFLPAGGYWSIAGLGCGTGFFVKNGTNNDGIHNGPPGATFPSSPWPTPPPRGANVSLSNFTLNGNMGNGHIGDSTSGKWYQSSNGTFLVGINLLNLNNITIENLVVVNTPTFHICFSNVGNVSVTGCVFEGLNFYGDGLHFNGPANDITISSCTFATGDDSIALNCPEGYGGNISRVTVTDCAFNSLSLMRLYTTLGGPQYTIDAVSVSNCTGTLWDVAFFIGFVLPSQPNSITGLTVSNCNLTAPAILGVIECFGAIAFSNINFVPCGTGLWVASEKEHVSAILRPPPSFAGVKFVGSSLTLQNFVIQRYSGVNFVGMMLENNSSIEYLEFNGFDLQNEGTSSLVPYLIEIDQGSIGQLVFDSLQSTNIKSPVSAGGFSSVELVSGAGVLATGWEFPNEVMANNVPYISAETGLPSIKINGVVEPYPLP